jgi:hypothetical protein
VADRQASICPSITVPGDDCDRPIDCGGPAGFNLSFYFRTGRRLRSPHITVLNAADFEGENGRLEGPPYADSNDSVKYWCLPPAIKSKQWCYTIDLPILQNLLFPNCLLTLISCLILWELFDMLNQLYQHWQTTIENDIFCFYFLIGWPVKFLTFYWQILLSVLYFTACCYSKPLRGRNLLSPHSVSGRTEFSMCEDLDSFKDLDQR